MQDVVTVAEDLRICTVKNTEELERRFCFEVVTNIRSCMLQADSEALRRKWVTYLEAGIARALRISASNKVCYRLAPLQFPSVSFYPPPVGSSPPPVGATPLLWVLVPLP